MPYACLTKHFFSYDLIANIYDYVPGLNTGGGFLNGGEMCACTSCKIIHCVQWNSEQPPALVAVHSQNVFISPFSLSNAESFHFSLVCLPAQIVGSLSMQPPHYSTVLGMCYSFRLNGA